MNPCRIAALLALAAMACAQTGEERVKALLVMITAQWDDSAQNGAGIIVGHRQDRLYILTANHVVRSGPREAKSVVARLYGLSGETQAAKISEDFDPALDLAVLIVPGASALGVATLPFGILGDSSKLERETGRVRAMGYPTGKPWFARPLLDVVSEATVESIRFDSPSMVKGYSGGGLFNDKWELVGIGPATGRRGFENRACHGVAEGAQVSGAVGRGEGGSSGAGTESGANRTGGRAGTGECGGWADVCLDSAGAVRDGLFAWGRRVRRQ